MVQRRICFRARETPTFLGLKHTLPVNLFDVGISNFDKQNFALNVLENLNIERKPIFKYASFYYCILWYIGRFSRDTH